MHDLLTGIIVFVAPFLIAALIIWQLGKVK